MGAQTMQHHSIRFAKFITFAILGMIAAMPAQAVVCPANPSVLGVFFIDLRIGFSVSTTEGAVTVLEPPQSNADCTDGSLMSVIKIDVPDECTQVNVLVEYEGEPSGWTLNLGDSATNNGFGGDAGTTRNNAELQVLEQQMSVYNASDDPDTVDRLVHQHLALDDGAIRLTVADQTVGWGQPRGILQTPGLGRLFAIPDEVGDERSIYLGINRVINDTNRRGCGVRRVLVSFE